jgi:hypothetical protein
MQIHERTVGNAFGQGFGLGQNSLKEVIDTYKAGAAARAAQHGIVDYAANLGRNRDLHETKPFDSMGRLRTPRWNKSRRIESGGAVLIRGYSQIRCPHPIESLDYASGEGWWLDPLARFLCVVPSAPIRCMLGDPIQGGCLAHIALRLLRLEPFVTLDLMALLLKATGLACFAPSELMVRPPVSQCHIELNRMPCRLAEVFTVRFDGPALRGYQGLSHFDPFPPYCARC